MESFLSVYISKALHYIAIYSVELQNFGKDSTLIGKRGNTMCLSTKNELIFELPVQYS